MVNETRSFPIPLACGSPNTKNQLSACFSYDAAGNLTTNGSTNYTYDAENRLTVVSGSPAWYYVYDGDGNRVEKCTSSTCPTNGTGTAYWRNLGDATISESSLNGTVNHEYIFFSGDRVARRDISGNSVHYYFSDHLGTHAVVENAAGTQCEQDVDYYPYGGVVNDYCNTPVAQNYKFNGKERDIESGLDNFGARYDASSMGRFMTPDWAAKATAVPYANFGNPQSLNLYSYVENNPTTMGDPDGHEITALPSGSNGNTAPPGNTLCYNNPNNCAPGQQQWNQQQAQNTSAQQPALVPLSSDVHYTVANNGPNAPEVHPVFSPETATHLNAAFSELNKDGITPQINSAFRTSSDQAYMQSGGSGTNPAAKVSWHEAGAAVDINGTHSSQFKTITSVMKKNGFVWGGDFKSKKDPPHFDGRQFMGNMNQAVRKAQGYWDETH